MTAVYLTHSLCPCGSGQPYAVCCEPLIVNKLAAGSAEQLMRSRYSAYCKGQYSYIQRTYVPRLQDAHPEHELAEFGNAVTFIGLQIKSAPGPADQVNFIARYLIADRLELLEEVSSFERIDGRWYYRDGLLTPHPAVKIGRNDTCPCGSGLKFKKCEHKDRN